MKPIYRVLQHFEPDTDTYYTVQKKTFLFWTTMTCQVHQDAAPEPIKFGDFEAARTYAEKRIIKHINDHTRAEEVWRS